MILLRRAFTVLVSCWLTIGLTNGNCQSYPAYGHEIEVTINGLSFDAMEPFISSDDKYLFFNNLNDGVNTRLFYATKVNDSTFNFVGELLGTNQLTSPHLDAVADMDSLNNFYWTSTRAYPAEFDNLFRGNFNNGEVTNTGRVHGDFYIYSPGWLIMDHGISYDGQMLYFNNARFDGVCQGPCETWIGIAKKENDSTFSVIPNSDQIMQNINDANYIYYAPCISKDNLELYFTRYLKGTITTNTLFEVCVAVRNTPIDEFSVAQVLFSEVIANIVEAPTITEDKQILYYHKKVNGIHKIMMRYKQLITGFNELNLTKNTISIVPNPMTNKSIIKFDSKFEKPLSLLLVDSNGRTVKRYNDISSNQVEIQINDLNAGLYIVQVFSKNKVVATSKLLVK